MKLIVRIGFLLVTLLSVSCSVVQHQNEEPLNLSSQYYNYIQPSFSDYTKATQQWLSKNRTYITAQHQKEITMNMPYELKHQHQSDKAILLVHGLGDSPYSFSDLAQTLHQQGFVVQTLLLPGHGSKPEDLMLPTYNDWQQIVDHYANQLKQQYKTVWLGGFSTGGNLVTIHAIEQGNIDGLLLFSPGFQSRTPILEKFAALASIFTDGYTAEERNVARYTSAPLKGAIAYTESARKLRQLLENNEVNVPTLIAISESDSVVDPDAVKDLYLNRFNNKLDKMIWYGESEFSHSNIKSLTMKLSSERISTGSHMSPLFAPTNSYYGKQGERRMCMNSFDDAAIENCENGAEVWFSAWGYEEENKIHARLTWNPHYADLAGELSKITSW